MGLDADFGFQNAVRDAGIEEGFHFHDLRHTFASHFLKRTGDLKALQEILGHEHITTTMRYVHFLPGHLKDAMNKFQKN